VVRGERDRFQRDLRSRCDSLLSRAPIRLSKAGLAEHDENCGTRSSNPLPSSGESRANPTSLIRAQRRVSRPGFERLVAWLCAGEVGAVLCFDASRLARNDQSSNRQAARPQVAAKAFRARDRDRRSRGQLPGLPPLPRDDTRSAAPPGTVAITDPRARTRFVILFAKARMGWRETGVDEHRGKPGGRMIYRVQRPRSSATNSEAARRCRRDLLQSSAPPTGYSPSSSGTPCRSALPARARPSSDSSHHGARPENSGPAPPSSCTSGGT
jgi:hypothetical protein